MKKLVLSSFFCFTVALMHAQTSDTISGIGNHTWTAPAGVTTVEIDVWGTGGNGGDVGGGGYGGSGGGGGGYSKKNILAVIPLTTYVVHIGPAGEVTYFKDSSTVLANNGQNGSTGPVPDPLSGGLGGSTAGAVGDIVMAGGNGGDWSNLYGSGGSGGGSAGAGGNGGNGASSPSFGIGGAGGTAGTGTPGGIAGADGVGFGAAGLTGAMPGGGGSGGGNMSTTVNGGAGGSGMVVITYVSSLSISALFAEDNSVNVFPNPSRGLFTVTSDSYIQSVTVFSLVGEIVFVKEDIATASVAINLSALASGIYFVQVNSAIGTSTEKISFR